MESHERVSGLSESIAKMKKQKPERISAVNDELRTHQNLIDRLDWWPAAFYDQGAPTDAIIIIIIILTAEELEKCPEDESKVTYWLSLNSSTIVRSRTPLEMEMDGLEFIGDQLRDEFKAVNSVHSKIDVTDETAIFPFPDPSKIGNATLEQYLQAGKSDEGNRGLSRRLSHYYGRLYFYLLGTLGIHFSDAGLLKAEQLNEMIPTHLGVCFRSDKTHFYFIYANAILSSSVRWWRISR
jgi:hypothetical protein